jgi:hypothetical protein
VSQPTDNIQDQIADLPNPELNPLLNPVLGRHLGQWAHVYFTTAPELREEALFDLLGQLKAEEARNGGPPAEGAADAKFADGIYAIVCPKCQRSNIRSQKFCGMCGSLMPVRAQAAAAASGGGPVGEALFSSTYDSPAEEESAAAAGMMNAVVPEAPAETEFAAPKGAFTATSLLFQPEPEYEARAEEPRANSWRIEERPTSMPPVDIDWLRERNALLDAEGPGKYRIATYVLGIAVVLSIAILAYFYMQRSEAQQRAARSGTTEQTAPAAGTGATGSTSSPPAAPAPSTAPAAQAGPTTFDALPGNSSADGQMLNRSQEARTRANEATYPAGSQKAATPAPAIPQKAAAPPASTARTVSPAMQQTPMAERTATAQKAAGESAGAAPSDTSQSGAAELAIAKEYLSGKNGRRDSAAAAQMLWKAVGKQNGGALLMLSDMYASGTGVGKSCDQARLLIDAALRKNVPAADLKLRELQKTCQ